MRSIGQKVKLFRLWANRTPISQTTAWNIGLLHVVGFTMITGFQKSKNHQNWIDFEGVMALARKHVLGKNMVFVKMAMKS